MKENSTNEQWVKKMSRLEDEAEGFPGATGALLVNNQPKSQKEERMDCKPWKKLAKTELRADIVICLIIALGVCLVSGLGANIVQNMSLGLLGLAVTGLAIGLLLGLLAGRSHGLVAGLIIGMGTCLSVGLGILVGLALSALFGTYTTCWIIAILLLVAKWFYIRELCLKTLPKN